MSINEQKIGPNKTLMIVTDKVKCDWDVSQTPQPQKNGCHTNFYVLAKNQSAKNLAMR